MQKKKRVLCRPSTTSTLRAMHLVLLVFKTSGSLRGCRHESKCFLAFLLVDRQLGAELCGHVLQGIREVKSSLSIISRLCHAWKPERSVRLQRVIRLSSP